MDKKNSISLEDLAFKFVPIHALLMWGLIRLVYWVSTTPMTDGHSSGAMINAVLMLLVGWVMIFPMYVAKNFKIEIEIDHKKRKRRRAMSFILVGFTVAMALGVGAMFLMVKTDQTNMDDRPADPRPWRYPPPTTTTVRRKVRAALKESPSNGKVTWTCGPNGCHCSYE